MKLILLLGIEVFGNFVVQSVIHEVGYFLVPDEECYLPAFLPYKCRADAHSASSVVHTASLRQTVTRSTCRSDDLDAFR